VTKYVLDASAILALLNDETGSDIVQELLPEAVISAVNFSEIIARLTLLGIPENEIHQALDILGLDIVPFDVELAYMAGLLSTRTKPFGLSLGDRACLALAAKNDCTAVTSDTAWGKLDLNTDIKLIR
jgi:ribonuclease VapC